MQKIIKFEEKSLIVDIRKAWGKDITISYDLFDANGIEEEIKDIDRPVFDKIGLREAMALAESGDLK